MFRPDFNLLDQLQAILEQTKAGATSAPELAVPEPPAMPNVPTPTLAPFLTRAEQAAAATQAQLAEVEATLQRLMQSTLQFAQSATSPRP